MIVYRESSMSVQEIGAMKKVFRGKGAIVKNSVILVKKFIDEVYRFAKICGLDIKIWGLKV